MSNNIAILVGGSIYTCLINEEGLTMLSEGSELETDLLNIETKEPTGKRASLRWDDSMMGDGELRMVPEDVSYDEAEKVELIIGRYAYNRLLREKTGRARLSYGDIYVSLVDNVSEFR